MCARATEHSRLQLQRGKLLQALLSEHRKRVQKLFYRFPGNQMLEADAVERIKRPGFAVLQDNSDSRNPIHLLAVNQVTKNIHRTERFRPFAAVQPGLRY